MPVDDVKNLIPTSKFDSERAEAAVRAGYPAVEPILGDLLKWLQDYNWPVAKALAPFLASIGAPVVPHIWQVLRSDDQVWKYWVISLLIARLQVDVAAEFRPEIERLCLSPKPAEKLEELDEVAKQVMNDFAWLPTFGKRG